MTTISSGSSKSGLFGASAKGGFPTGGGVTATFGVGEVSALTSVRATTSEIGISLSSVPAGDGKTGVNGSDIP